jgi:hypothetical protein
MAPPLFTQVTMGEPQRHPIDLSKIDVGRIPQYKAIVEARQGPIPEDSNYFADRIEIDQENGVFHFSIGSSKGGLVYCVGCTFEAESERAWKMAEERFLAQISPGFIQRLWLPPPAPWLATTLIYGTKNIDDNTDEWLGEAENTLAWSLFALIEPRPSP